MTPSRRTRVSEHVDLGPGPEPAPELPEFACRQRCRAGPAAQQQHDLSDRPPLEDRRVLVNHFRGPHRHSHAPGQDTVDADRTLDGTGSRRCSSECCCHETPALRSKSGGCPAGREDRRRSEAGDTLIEILIALTVIGVAATAISWPSRRPSRGRVPPQRGDHGHHAQDCLRRGHRGHTAAVEHPFVAVVRVRIRSTRTSRVHSSAGPQLHVPPSPRPSTGIRRRRAFSLGPVTPPSTSCPGGVTGGGPAAAHRDGGLPRQWRRRPPRRTRRWSTTRSLRQVAGCLQVRRLPTGLGPSSRSAGTRDRRSTTPHGGARGRAPTGCVVQTDASQVQLAITPHTGTHQGRRSTTAWPTWAPARPRS